MIVKNLIKKLINKINIIFKIYLKLHSIKFIHGDWGLGIGDWGLGIGDWAQSPIPNPQSPIPNPPIPKKKIQIFLYKDFNIYLNILIYK